jgi:hypothetical protein
MVTAVVIMPQQGRVVLSDDGTAVGVNLAMGTSIVLGASLRFALSTMVATMVFYNEQSSRRRASRFSWFSKGFLWL